jgi:hypothetical protein
MQINTGSELLEVLFTPEETNRAMQLCDTPLSIAYLTNTRIGIMRQLAEQEFTDPVKDPENQRIRAYLKGQYDLLGALIEGAVNPTPVPLDTGNPSQTSPGA